MSESDVLDALDRMIADFGNVPATPSDKLQPVSLDVLDVREIGTSKDLPSIPAALDAIGRLDAPKQDIYGASSSSSSSSKKFDETSEESLARQSYIFNVQNVQSVQSRSSSGEILGRSLDAGVFSVQTRTNPRFFVAPEAYFECFFHIQHGEIVAPGLCAGCRAPIAEGVDALDLADGNRVHLDADYRCLIAWGRRWRSAARAAAAFT